MKHIYKNALLGIIMFIMIFCTNDLFAEYIFMKDGKILNGTITSDKARIIVVWNIAAQGSGSLSNLYYCAYDGGVSGPSSDANCIDDLSSSPFESITSTDANFLYPAAVIHDEGTDAAVPSGITTDLAGNPRVVGSAVDIGAYEAQ